MKPDYIPKEDITKELEEIEQNLNELEKRGVDLEVKLRKCEEGGMHAPAVCFVKAFQSGRAVNVREILMYVSGINCVLCVPRQRVTMTLSRTSSWLSGLV